MTFRAKSPSPSPSPADCPRHGAACRYPSSRPARGIVHEWPRDPLERVPSAIGVRIRRGLGRMPFAFWFLVGLVVTRLLHEAGLLPPLDWLPGEPRR